jgi:hypothetical protein
MPRTDEGRLHRNGLRTFTYYLFTLHALLTMALITIVGKTGSR